MPKAKQTSNYLETLLKGVGPTADFRVALLHQFPEIDVKMLIEYLEAKWNGPCHYFTSGELESNTTIVNLAKHDPPIIIFDAYHETDPRIIIGPLKLLLKHVSETKVFVIGQSNIREVSIPSNLGKMLNLHFDRSVLPVDDDHHRSESELLKHSRKLSPKYSERDLVLSPRTQLKFNEAIEYIRSKHHIEYDWGFRKRHSRGHGVTLMFHGPSGTGKTMAAEVVANTLNLPLYQIDLSSVVSKWIGETEKNLKAIFRAAEGVKGILLFDEADAIFGQRTNVKDSHDKYSNLEVNYLLQEIEAFDGIAILSTNYENNMDEAFLRRFTYSIIFGKPTAERRHGIWKSNIPEEMPVAPNVDFTYLSSFPMTGGNIRNCIRMAAANTAALKKTHVDTIDFLWAIKRELQKHGVELEREAVGEEYWKRVAVEWEHLKFNKAAKNGLKESDPNG